MSTTNIDTLIGHIINGRDVASTGAPSGTVISVNPYSGDAIWHAAAANATIVDAAVHAAQKALASWMATPYEDRRELLSQFVKLVQRDATDLARLIAQEAGKPLWEAATEVNSLVTKFGASVDAYAARAAESSREVKGLRSRTRFMPHGVMAVLGPFNFPVSMANSHIMPSLLAGNTVVFKPSELTPVAGLLVSRLWQEAGLPPGVMNCVTGGRETGEQLVGHPDIDGVLFVGSYRVGMSILHQLIDHPEKIVALEMGGNSPLVVLDYDDLDTAVHIIVQSTFLSAGQRCSAARRLFVPATDRRIIERLTEVLSHLTIGDPLSTEPSPFYGPLIRQQAANGVLSRSGELMAAGAAAILQPTAIGPQRTVVTPGLLDMTTCTDDRDEEIFGPVLKVRRFENLGEAIRMANDTRFGLAAGIICRDRARFDEFFDRTRAGIVNWNQQLTGATTLAPFGGIKQSGNFRPAGFLSVDYCSYAVASFEVETPRIPESRSPGINF